MNSIRSFTVAAMALTIGCPHCTATQRAQADSAAGFTLLEPVRPAIIASSPAYPGGNYEVGNLLDSDQRTEYSSAGNGTGTFVDFDLGAALRIGGFYHVDRTDPATISESRLTFSDSPQFENVLGQVKVQHANSRGGRTQLAFPPVTARFVRWQVTELGPKRYGTVGGSEIGLYRATGEQRVPDRLQVHCSAVDAVMRDKDRLVQPVRLTIDFPYAEPVDAMVQVADLPPLPIHLTLGEQSVPLPPLPAADKEIPVEVVVEVAGHRLRNEITVRPVRHWEFWLLPHSHNDIGYTHVQDEVERKQWQYLTEAAELAERTANYPSEARFKWNAEVMWAVDSYLKQATPEQRERFVDAVRCGQIGLDGLYGNELTGLCRPEELFRLIDCARRLRQQYGVRIDSAMISDVPGYTWGIVSALAHSGVKYFSIGPNHIHRIGYTLRQWGDRPFYWMSPSGDEKILCWMAGHGYSWFHAGLMGSINGVAEGAFFTYLDRLTSAGYPYDMVQLRYNIGGDNGPPDPELPEYVKQWNARYVWPKMIIATTSQMMHEFERRYGDQIPEARGDFTPYWEDGAASSARETAWVRNASERLVQAETLWAMLRPTEYPDAECYRAWRNVILYNEHTWGAHCSITQPDIQFTLDQWKTKQAFAVDARRKARQLLDAAFDSHGSGGEVTAVDVYNTCSWPRTDLVELPVEMEVQGDIVKTAEGRLVPSQRLVDGRLAFLAADVPPLGARRFLLSPGTAAAEGNAKVDGTSLSNDLLRVQVDEQTGGLASLVWKGANIDFASDRQCGLNEYFYVAGRDPSNVQRAGPPQIRALERGPLVASLAVESEAPGCKSLVRTLRVVGGLPRVDLTNRVDRLKIRSPNALHFAFAPNVREGVMRMDIPWAIIRPEQDQLPGACKNYFTVGRWVDVSNDALGLTWATLDAPLVEVGRITMDVGNPFAPGAWIERLEPTQTFYSYVMNNYWETNYKASQEGPMAFRYSLLPHGPFDAAAAVRFGMERSNPLVAVPASTQQPVRAPLLRVEPDDVIVSSIKPTADGQALILRLFNASDRPTRCELLWNAPVPRLFFSSPSEEAGKPLQTPIVLPKRGIVTLRADIGGQP